ncbi:MAG: GspH/FimT family protein [Pseudomonadota bacterium]
MRSSSTGTTLIELIAALAVAALLFGLAAPSLTRTIALNHRIAETNRLLGLVQYARREAIHRHADVVICPSADGLVCSEGVDAWQQGILVFEDQPVGPPYALDDPRYRLRAARGSTVMHLEANRPLFVFRPLARRSTNGTWRLCHPHGHTSPRALIVAPNGRPRVSTRLPDGAPIPCPP